MSEQVQFTFEVTTQQVLGIADAFIRRYTTRREFEQNPHQVYWDDFEVVRFTDARIFIEATRFERWSEPRQEFTPKQPVVGIELFPRSIEVAMMVARREDIEALPHTTGIEHGGIGEIVRQGELQSRDDLETFFDGLVAYFREKLQLNEPTPSTGVNLYNSILIANGDVVGGNETEIQTSDDAKQ